MAASQNRPSIVGSLMSVLGSMLVLVLIMMFATYLLAFGDTSPSVLKEQLRIVILVGCSSGWIGGCILWHARSSRNDS